MKTAKALLRWWIADCRDAQRLRRAEYPAPGYGAAGHHHIAEIIEITEQLIAKGHAYVADNGDVMFDVPTDPNYGQLSRQDLDQLQAGARVDVVDVKHNPMDFVL